MNDLVAQIELALATVQRTLDLLTTRGHDEAAYEIAKLQFSANMRASWPGNLGPLASCLERIAGDMGLSLTEADRTAARDAGAVLRKMIG